MELIEQWLNRIILTRWRDPTKKQTKQNKTIIDNYVSTTELITKLL